MINDGFVNACYILCFNKYNEVKKDKKIYLDLKSIIDSYAKINKDDFPMDFAAKLRLFRMLLNGVIEGKPVEYVLSKINWKGVFDERLKGVVEHLMTVKLDDKDMLINTERISSSREYLLLLENVKKVMKPYNKFVNNEYENIDDIVNECLNESITFSNKINECKRIESLNSTGNFSCGEDDFEDSNMEPTANILLEVNDDSNKIISGYDAIDTNILRGGFAKKATYIIAGSAKSGKSTIMNNMLLNAAKVNYHDTEKKRIFVYISLENQLQEAMQRTFCREFNLSPEEHANRMKEDKQNFMREQNAVTLKYNNIINFGYKASKSISASDLYPYLDSILELYNDRYGEVELGALFVDYLLHLKSEGDNEYRLQLSDSVQILKNIAIDYSIPVITATQLNREAVRVSNSNELHIGMVAESHALNAVVDGMFLLACDNKDNKLVHFNSGIQRGGKSNIPVDFKVDFDKLAFISTKCGVEQSAPLDTVSILNDYDYEPPKTKTFTGFDFKAEGV